LEGVAGKLFRKRSEMTRREKWLKIVPLVLFVLLAIFVKAGMMIHFEGWAYNEAIEKMTPRWTAIVKFITHMGDTAFVLIFCLMLIAIKRSRKTIAFPVSLAVIVSTLLNLLMKNLFSRQRPDILRLINETSYSFPSGHAMINATLYTMLVLLAFWFLRNRLVKTLLAVFCIVLIIAIGYSRIYLGVHFIDDVLGGWLIGFNVSIRVYFSWSARHERPRLLEPGGENMALA
jgi:undecaprenyl-diphosphatase